LGLTIFAVYISSYLRVDFRKICIEILFRKK
jgi:hypothetical protein